MREQVKGLEKDNFKLEAKVEALELQRDSLVKERDAVAKERNAAFADGFSRGFAAAKSN